MFVGIANFLSKFKPASTTLSKAENQYQQEIESGYPSNHCYKIKNNVLIPKYKLAARYKKIHKLLPEKFDSLAEIGCSKGFFVLSAEHFPHCRRGLGIDVDANSIKLCDWVKNQIQNTNAMFKKMQLHELAARIDEFGGPFQTVLILNTYQYLYFGSDFFPECYLNHDLIFRHLRKICSGRIIFNNRIDLQDCQNVAKIKEANEIQQANYTEQNALAIAANYFTVNRHGSIGKYPLFTLDANSHKSGCSL